MSKKSSRVPTTSAAPLVHSPFAGIEMSGLPDGPEEPPVEQTPEAPAKRGRVVLRREKSGRGGKVVTVAYDFDVAISEEELHQLAKTARQACGCGGTVRDRTIELQGEQVQKARAYLASLGFRVVGEI